MRLPAKSAQSKMLYTERPPNPALSRLIRCIWIFEASPADGGSEIQRVVPDGYPEMVLHYGDRCHEISANGIRKQQSRFVFAGQMSEALLLRPGSYVGMIGIRLLPSGARIFLGMPMRETTDRRLDLAEFWAHESEALVDAVGNADNIDARLDVIQRFLLDKLAHAGTKSDAAVNHAVSLLQSAPERLSIDALAARCALSPRQLERRFLDEVGIPPRLLASIFRFRRVFDLLEQPQPGRWAGAAIGAGYFDQAHMIRDFKRFSGLKPQAFYGSLNGFSAAMVGNDAEAIDTSDAD
jgi:AraC-like DNA-binding protein